MPSTGVKNPIASKYKTPVIDHHNCDAAVMGSTERESGKGLNAKQDYNSGTA